LFSGTSIIEVKILEKPAALGAAAGVVPPLPHIERSVTGDSEHHRVDVGAGFAEGQAATVAGGEGGIPHPLEERIERHPVFLNGWGHESTLLVQLYGERLGTVGNQASSFAGSMPRRWIISFRVVGLS
jgi:hypothetical protein